MAWHSPRGAFNPIVSDGQTIYITGFSSIAALLPKTKAEEKATAARQAKKRAEAKAKAKKAKQRKAAKKRKAARRKAAKKKRQRNKND